MLWLVVGMLVGHSVAEGETPEWDTCYKNCAKDCFKGSYSESAIACGNNCTSYCNLEVGHQLCFLFWCWNVKI